MDQALQEALFISMVGMLTVFIILFAIVIAGYVLMKILERTNFIFNEDQNNPDQDLKLHSKIIAKAIANWSGGKATVKEIRNKE